MWKSSVGAKADDEDKKDDDDWDTDPDFVNNVSEQEQRWGSKAIEGSGRVGVVKMDQLRQDVAQDDSKNKQESKRENFAYGYGGKFGVQTDRKDKSAVGHDTAQEKFVHSSQVDGKKGFGGQFGVQSDRQDKSAAGFDVEKKQPPAVSSKPKIEVPAGSAKNRFEQLAKENEEKSKQEAERVRQERNANDKRRQEEEAKLADAREAEAEKQAKARAAAAPPKAAPAPVVKATPAPAPAAAAPAPVKAAAMPPPPKQPQPEEEEEQPEPEVQPEVEEQQPEPEPEPQAQEADEWADQPAAEEEAPTSEAAPSGGSGLTAVALYDYQAGGPDEITFDPEEVITDIEQVDEGWWMGTCRGHRGLFPSNFVTLQ